MITGRAGLALRQDEGLEGRLAQDLAGQAKPCERHPPVLGLGEIIRIDQRHGGDVGAGEPHRAAGFRPDEGGIHRDAGIPQARDSRLDAGAEAEMELDIGPSLRRVPAAVAIPEAAGLEQGGGDRAAAEQQIFEAGPERAMRPGIAVIAMVAGAFGDGIEIEMVLEIGSDARQIVHARARRPISGDPPGRCPRASAAAASRWRRR